jgi:hypothetical protein
MFHVRKFDADAVHEAGDADVTEAGTEAFVTRRSTVAPAAAQQNPE